MRTAAILVAVLALSGIVGNRSVQAQTTEQPSQAQVPPPLSATLTQIAGEPNDQQRQRLFYSLLGRLERRELRIETEAEAAELASFMAERTEHDPSKLLRGRAAEFLASNPHPAAADALLRSAALSGSEEGIGRNARAALVSLHDRRVLPLLLAKLRPGSENVEGVRAASGKVSSRLLRQLAELGDPAALVALQELAAMPDLDAKSRDDVLRAIRDLKLLIDSHIVNSFDLDDHAQQALQRHGFVICPSDANEMFKVYEEAYPLVTSDVVFHTFMILERATLDELESLVLAPRLASFTAQAERACRRQARSLRDRRLASLAQQNTAFLAVPAILLGARDSTASGLPQELRDRVRQEVRRINGHAEQDTSCLFGYVEDYTKYAPRGRGSDDPARQGYYRAILYLGRTMFRLDSEEESRRAFLLTDAIARSGRLREEWSDLDDLLDLFFGPRDDLAPPDYEAAASSVPMPRSAAASDFRHLMRDDAAFHEAVRQLRQYPRPRINSAYVGSVGEAREWKERKAGMRVFGQRYCRPLDVIQQCLDAGYWPSGLLVAARLMGSQQAADLWSERGERPRAPLATPARTPGDSSLAEALIDACGALFRPEPGAPAFMRQAPWEEKQINTALGCWAEVQHATTLYTKDANTYYGMSAVLDRFHGYVEPVPRFYSTLSELVARMLRLTDRCGLFEKIAADNEPNRAAFQATNPQERLRRGEHPSPQDYRKREELAESSIRVARADFEEFSLILAKLQSIAEKELRGEGQSIDDGFFLKNLHKRLMYLSFNRSGCNVARQSMAVVTDVATDYRSRKCLEVGVGRPLVIYAAIPDSDRTFICKGAVYSYYEFERPIDERLDDATWRDLSQYPDECPESPWLAVRPELGYDRVLSRAELKALRSQTSEDGSTSAGGPTPWRPHPSMDAARDLTGGRVTRADIDLLLSLAAADTINLGVRVFALKRLAAFGTDLRVLACYRDQVQRVSVGGRVRNHLDAARLYFSVRGLGNCGVGAIPVLREAEGLAATAESLSQDAYQAALRDARNLIEVHPRGRDTIRPDRGQPSPER